MSQPEAFDTELSGLSRARAACWRLHRMKVGWRLVDVIEQYAGDFDEIHADPEVDPEVVLSDLRCWEVDLGKRAGIPPSTWINRRVRRLTRGVRSSPPPATSNPAGTSSPQAQGGT